MSRTLVATWSITAGLIGCGGGGGSSAPAPASGSAPPVPRVPPPTEVTFKVVDTLGRALPGVIVQKGETSSALSKRRLTPTAAQLSRRMLPNGSPYRVWGNVSSRGGPQAAFDYGSALSRDVGANGYLHSALLPFDRRSMYAPKWWSERRHTSARRRLQRHRPTSAGCSSVCDGSSSCRHSLLTPTESLQSELGRQCQ